MKTSDTLFSDDFPIVTSEIELEIVKREFHRYEYDSCYVTVGCKKSKSKLDILWEKFKPYADTHFLSEIKKHFHQRTWEMYVACIFLKKGFQIESSDNRPDIKIVLGNQIIWIECVACDVGIGKDAVPPLKYDSSLLQDYPEKQLLLRMTNSLDAKLKKYKEYLEKKIVGKEDIFIIAINRAGIDHCDPGIPLIFKAVFGIEHLNIPIHPLNGAKSEKGSFWSIRDDIVKQNDENISVKFFEKQEHSGISAIIYSNTNILNHPNNIGSECILTHNPIAKNILDDKIFPFFDQYKIAADKIIKL
jgi:type I restriction enzyme S subunit